MNREKYLWLTDTHLFPWNRKKILNLILNEKPRGVFLTGDISHSGPTCLGDLEYLGKKAGRPIYFVLGNHDYWLSSFKHISAEVKLLCSKYKNLIWMNNIEIEPLNEETVLIGDGGWYDASNGDTKYLKYTFDWSLIEELKQLSSMSEREKMFQSLAQSSAIRMAHLLEKAIELDYKTIYLLTHVPPYKEANRDEGTIMEKFWEPYNTNLVLGQALDEVMKHHKKKHLIILAGHTHCPVEIHASRNIECRVGKASYLNLEDGNRLFI